MPEGDTLFRAATTLRKAMEGARLLEMRTPLPVLEVQLEERPLAGQRLVGIEARGKNLLIAFEDGRVLRTHLRMSGSWHLYRQGEPWLRPERQSRVSLHADNGFVAVCFNAPVVELLSARQLRDSQVSRLGPDATTDAFDLDEALRRLRALPGTVGEALLTQHALAGVGNVIKSEALFICRSDPFTAVASAPEDGLRKLVAECHRLLLRNRVAGPRTTRESLDGKRYWVYGRSGKPCRICGTPLRMRRQGPAARSTYFCSACQGCDATTLGFAPDKG